MSDIMNDNNYNIETMTKTMDDLEDIAFVQDDSLSTSTLQNALAPSVAITPVTKPTTKAGIRQHWKERGANGDKDALDKLAAIREADRNSRRKSRQLLKNRSENGDAAAIAILERVRKADTAIHRKRKASLIANAAAGDADAIEILARAKERDAEAHRKYRASKRLNKLEKEKSEVNIEKEHNIGDEVTTDGNDTSNSISNTNPNVNTNKKTRRKLSSDGESYVDVEAEAVSALGLLQRG